MKTKKKTKAVSKKVTVTKKPAKPAKPAMACTELVKALGPGKYHTMRKYTAAMLAALVDDMALAIRKRIHSRVDGKLTALELVKYLVAIEGERKTWSRGPKTPGASRGRPRKDGSPAQPRKAVQAPPAAAVARVASRKALIPTLKPRDAAPRPFQPIAVKPLKLKIKSKA